MDRSATSGNNGSGRTTNGTHSDLPDLATYQAQWAKIHDDTVRQINEALGMYCPLLFSFVHHLTP